jgi:phosphoribosylanthranilate isomerase
VFVNESSQMIRATLVACGLDLAQLSGEENSDLVTGKGSPILGRAYQALRPKSTSEARESAPAFAAPTGPDAPSLLLDTYHPALRGGTGTTADWVLAAEISRMTPRMMLAGGLTPDNVAAAVAQVNPFAVDVASGVEASPGRKDPDKVRHFLAAAKDVP